LKIPIAVNVFIGKHFADAFFAKFQLASTGTHENIRVPMLANVKAVRNTNIHQRKILYGFVLTSRNRKQPMDIFTIEIPTVTMSE